MFGLEKRQRMLADPVIPVGMINPSDFEIILKSKLQMQVRTMTQLIEKDAIKNSFDPDIRSIALVKQFPAAVLDFRHANRSDAKECLGGGEIHAGFLFFRVDVEQHHTLY